jgi:hypothetical protein
VLRRVSGSSAPGPRRVSGGVPHITERGPVRSDTLQVMSVSTVFDILLVAVALLVTWFAAFVVLRLFKG